MVTAVAAGYLWAAVAGDGIHGLKGTAALGKADSFPDANVVFIVALAVYGWSPLCAAFWGGADARAVRTREVDWCHRYCRRGSLRA
jgi:hypothetical protein